MRRLTLNRESLTALSGEELASVAGGTTQTGLTWQVICTGQTDRTCVTISPDICSS